MSHPLSQFFKEWGRERWGEKFDFEHDTFGATDVCSFYETNHVLCFKEFMSLVIKFIENQCLPAMGSQGGEGFVVLTSDFYWG